MTKILSAKSSYPSHWKIVRLGDYVVSEKGKKPKNLSDIQTDKYPIPYIDIKAFEKNIVDKFTDGEKCRLCYEEDILMVWDGSRSGLVSKGKSGALGSTLVRLNFPDMLNEYAYYFMKSKYLEINSRAKGATTPHVDPHLLWNYEFPLPPLDEQNRIVNKIESLLSELDSSIENLQRAKEKLKLYRQSVLKSAFEGKLTEAWRQAHADELEDAEVLLERIKQEREAAHEESLVEWEASVKAWEKGGKVGKKPAKPKKPKELPPLSGEELEALPELPEGWKWTRIDSLGDIQLGRQRSPKNISNQYPTKYIRAANITEDGISVKEVFDMEFTPEEFKKYVMKYGDIVVSEASGSPDQVGKPAIWRDDIENCCFQNTVIRLRPAVKIYDFIFWYLKKMYVFGEMAKLAGGVGINHLSAGKFSTILIPICSLEEQKVIVKVIVRTFNEIEVLEKTINASLEKAESLRQSILKSAFEGRLVSCEPVTTSLFKAPPEPINIGGISTTDLHAGIIALTYKIHQERGYLDKLNHVKHEKIAHLTESIVGINLCREPVQDAAGPDDYNHLKKVEHRARMARWFMTEKERIGYRYKPLQGFDRCIAKTKEALGEHLERVERLVTLMLPMDMERAEIFATTYAAWNNMLIDGLEPTDEEIVHQAREEWSSRKLTLKRERFFKALKWMREKNIVPMGNGKYVKPMSKKK